MQIISSPPVAYPPELEAELQFGSVSPADRHSRDTVPDHNNRIIFSPDIVSVR